MVKNLKDFNKYVIVSVGLEKFNDEGLRINFIVIKLYVGIIFLFITFVFEYLLLKIPRVREWYLGLLTKLTLSGRGWVCSIAQIMLRTASADLAYFSILTISQLVLTLFNLDESLISSLSAILSTCILLTLAALMMFSGIAMYVKPVKAKVDAVDLITLTLRRDEFGRFNIRDAICRELKEYSRMLSRRVKSVEERELHVKAFRKFLLVLNSNYIEHIVKHLGVDKHDISLIKLVGETGINMCTSLDPRHVALTLRKLLCTK